MASAATKEWYGREARKFSSYRDLLALKDIDAVMIASCDHQHTLHLKAAAEAGKDAYCEKPLAMRLDRLKDACDAAKKAKIVVQIGTQLRSYPTFTGCRELYKTGILGTVGRIEQCRNSAQPYWYRYVKDVKAKDVDWDEFLMDRPMRKFDPVLYSGWYGYREFSDGPVPGLGSHFIDLVHYITGATFPTNCVCLGGTYTWKDEHKFTCPDHVHALWTYPEGFMVSYSTNFGNGSGNSFKIFGDAGVIDMVNWNAPILTAEGANSKKKGPIRGKNPVKEVQRPDHFLDWLQCMRTRKTPNASIDAGYQHGVAVIMAMMSFDSGRRMVYDAKKREIYPG
jgi:predicted dehydrogenase